jgi:hypothetical protein
MQTITDKVIGKVYKGKSGESEYGPWQIWNFYLKGGKQKYSYFEKDGLIPQEGMKVVVMDYEVKQSGEFTNYNVKRLSIDDGHRTDAFQPIEKTAPKIYDSSINSDLGPVSMYVSYYKDIVLGLLNGVPLDTIPQHIDAVCHFANDILDESVAAGQRVVNGKPKVNTDSPEPEGFMDGPPPDDDIPY